ncbi:hypothetical protein LguiA_002841 [Lonicera macranthoides]
MGAALGAVVREAAKITSALIQERGFLNEVERQIKWIEKELRLMRATAEQEPVAGEAPSKWAEEEQDLVRELNDIAKIFFIRRRESRLRSFFARNKLAMRVEKLKVKIRKLSETKTREEAISLMAISAGGQFEASNSVICVINEANKVLSQNLLVVGGVSQQVEDIRNEFLHLLVFLKNVQGKGELSRRTKAWSRQVLEVSDPTKDLFQLFTREREKRLLENFNTASLILNDLKFGRDINGIHDALQNIYERRWRYGIGDHVEPSRTLNSLNPNEHVKKISIPSVFRLYGLCTNLVPLCAVVKIGVPRLKKKLALWWSVQNQLKSISQDLELMRALIDDVQGKEGLDQRVLVWVDEVEDIKHRTVDLLDLAGYNPEQGTARGFPRPEILKKIKQIKHRIDAVSERKRTYDMKHIKRGGEPDNNTVGSQHQATPRSFGLEQLDISLYDDRQAVKAQLLVHSEHHYITFIVGMEGIGKTTLANSICKDVDVIHCFPHRALVSIPSDKNFRALVNDIEEQLMASQEQKAREIVGVNGSHTLDANTCLIVLEDVRTVNEWNEVIKEFPSTFNGIRILATTRSLDVADFDDRRSVSHKMHLLSDDDSWFLFKHSLTIPPGVKDQDIRKKVLIPCGGLPKAILEVRKKFSQVECTCEAWLRLLETVQQNQEPWQETIRIYNRGFPIFLGQYLFIIAQFPTDFEIPVRRLTALWIAESSIHHWSSKLEEPPESAAKKHLTDLIDRNMIQVTKKKLNGEVKRCRLPHPLQEIRTSKVSHLVDYYNPGDSIFKHTHGGNEYMSTSSLSCYNDVISFTSFDPREGFTPGKELGKFLNICISSRCFKLLRVLDLEHVFRPELPEAIGNLDELRYLGLRWTYLQNLPPFISKLLNLQILDVKHTSISTLPRSIWKMHKMRHLYLNESYRCRLPSPQSLRTITDLQTLWGVFIDEESPVENGLDRLLSLKRLGLTSRLMASGNQDAMSKKLEAVADWVNRLKKLQSLRLKSLDEPNQPLDLHLKPLKGHTNLSTIYLLGRISNEFVASGLPMALTDLTLSGSGLKEDPMQALEKLPSLKILRLLGDTFIGTHMHCSSGGFLQLRVLKIWKLMHLEEWELREGALPNLIDLEIRSCIKLKVLPNGLLFLSTLSTLKLSGMPKEFIHTIKVNQIHEWDINITSDTSAILTPKRPKKIADVKVDASTSQNLSLFEDPIFAQESNSYDASNSFQEENVHQSQSTIPEEYRSSFHRKLWQYIRDVRQKLTGELIDHRADYEKIYKGEEKVDDLLRRLKAECNTFNEEYWMTFPEMGHLIASAYEIVLVLLAKFMCITFLPLRSMPSGDRPPEVIVIGHIKGNHYVKMSMSSDSPVPPISETWYENRDACADGWQTPYIDRIKKFEDLMGEHVVTRENFPKGEVTVGNENKDGYLDNGAAAKECSKDMQYDTKY